MLVEILRFCAKILFYLKLPIFVSTFLNLFILGTAVVYAVITLFLAFFYPIVYGMLKREKVCFCRRKALPEARTLKLRTIKLTYSFSIIFNSNFDLYFTY
jgi:hypothetical protein